MDSRIEKLGDGWELCTTIEDGEITYMSLECPHCKIACEEFIVVHSDIDRRYPNDYEDVKKEFLEDLDEDRCGYCDLEYPNGMRK